MCNEPTALLLLLNADLPEYFPNDERRLHVFACRKRRCGRKPGSIRAVREVRKHKTEEAMQPKGEAPSSILETQRQTNDLGATIFGVTSSTSRLGSPNPFFVPPQASSTFSNSLTSLPPTSTLAAKPPQPTSEPPTETLASKLRISSPPPSSRPEQPTESWPPESAFPPPFPYLHLDADYEALSVEKPHISDVSFSKTQTQYLEEDVIGSDTSGPDKDVFESSLDKTFLRFSDRLAQNPGQVLRYEWKGIPLLYSSTDAVGKRLTASHGMAKIKAGMPRCDSCGAERVFEMQLVPGAITALEENDVDLEDGMEWGTIIVGVCARNCGESGQVEYKEEWCGVQWEESG